jgi:hypothetical protein
MALNRNSSNYPAALTRGTDGLLSRIVVPRVEMALILHAAPVFLVVEGPT